MVLHNKGLGRGLDALFQGGNAGRAGNGGKDSPITLVPVAALVPNPSQPRSIFSEERLDELADSIKSQGIIQPLIVRPHGEEGLYEIIAGERRWRAARKAGLPEVIQSFIREHHGAGMAKYFYITYCRQHPDEEVDKTPFSYPGPDPQSRETSVLMMADAVEAASRSLTEHTREAITNLVSRIIDGQIADGLHNESTLEFRDVAKIKEAFIKRLMTIYHSRIAYPTSPKQ